MTSKVVLFSAAAAAVLLTGSAGFAQSNRAEAGFAVQDSFVEQGPRLGTVEHYSVQDGHNGVIRYRNANQDNVYAIERRAARTYAPFPERTKSGKN